MGVGSRAAALFEESVAPSSRWFCDVPGCEAQQARLDAWRSGVVRFAARPPED